MNMLRVSDNIILNADHMVMVERFGRTIKLACTNGDVITVTCLSHEDAAKALDTIMEQSKTDQLVNA